MQSMSRAPLIPDGRRSAGTASGRAPTPAGRAGAPAERDLRIQDLRVRVYGDVAVAMGEASAAEAGDAAGGARYHVTRVYAWRQGRWRRVAADTTPLARRDAC